MRIDSPQKPPVLYTLLLYVCGFLLFLEWLYPLKEISDTGELFIFILYTLFCFGLSLVNGKWWITSPLKGIAALLILNYLFIPYTIFSGAWFQYLFTDAANNLQQLAGQNYNQLTPMFRSLLFLILIWLISYLLYYWFIIMKRVFLFVSLTILYIAVLDTFTIYDAKAAVIRIVIFSFITLGLAGFMKELDKESIRFSWKTRSFIWLLPLAGLVIFSVMVGFAAPKYEPVWPDPVPFLKSAAQGGNGIIHKVGYGEDDSRLGGSFIQDSTPVFHATAKEKHYWRIETKDIYTGKGWERSHESSFAEQEGNRIALETFSEGVETEKRETQVDFGLLTKLKKIVYPYGIESIEIDQETQFSLDSETGEILASQRGREIRPKKYTISYNFPSFDITELEKVTETELPDDSRQFVQVPYGLPDRVGELAKEITAAYDNRYDKARAIERYFGENGFQYETQGIPVPASGQDYVDQFLFESKIGYCDNYSTSMVVMLRTLGIPARWAKGFTGGEVKEDSAGDGYDLYEITNSNAHSWVEVYFPGNGWVPFEPTQGFDNLADFHYTYDLDKQEDASDQPDEQETEKPEEKMEQETPEMQNDQPDAEESDKLAGGIDWRYAVISILVMGIILFIFYLKRLQLQTFLVDRKFNKERNTAHFQEAYLHLLKVLKHKGLGIQSGQTLREFAEQVDASYQNDAMRRLTTHYERLIYTNKDKVHGTEEMYELWKDLIKQITA